MVRWHSKHRRRFQSNSWYLHKLFLHLGKYHRYFDTLHMIVTGKQVQTVQEPAMSLFWVIAHKIHVVLRLKLDSESTLMKMLMDNILQQETLMFMKRSSHLLMMSMEGTLGFLGSLFVNHWILHIQVFNVHQKQTLLFKILQKRSLISWWVI